MNINDFDDKKLIATLFSDADLLKTARCCQDYTNGCDLCPNYKSIDGCKFDYDDVFHELLYRFEKYSDMMNDDGK